MFYKNVILAVTILLLNVNSFSQTKNDTVEYIYKHPVKEGYIYFHNENSGRLVDPVPYVFIYSKESDVFAFMEGKVLKTFKMGDEREHDHVIIKNKDTAVVYGNLSSIYKKVGDTVYRGELIGKMKKDIEGVHDRYELIFGIVVGLKSMIYTQYIEFFQKYK
jgi:hypothetical protein